MRMAICRICKREKPIAALGRCSTCYSYFNRTGIDRPEHLIDGYKPFCIDCKENPAYCLGRCWACYCYRLRRGKKRPVQLRKKHSLNCANPNCRKPLRLCKHPTLRRCDNCSKYYIRTGRERSARLARFECEEGYILCINPNCDRPLKICKSNGERCLPCHRWIKENQSERPRHLCPQRVTLGWCECGQVATEVMRFRL